MADPSTPKPIAHLGPLTRAEARALPSDLKAARRAHLRRASAKRYKAKLKATRPDVFRAKKREEARRWYEAHPEAEKARCRGYYHANREATLARMKARYWAARAVALKAKAHTASP